MKSGNPSLRLVGIGSHTLLYSLVNCLVRGDGKHLSKVLCSLSVEPDDVTYALEICGDSTVSELMEVFEVKSDVPLTLLDWTLNELFASRIADIRFPDKQSARR